MSRSRPFRADLPRLLLACLLACLAAVPGVAAPLVLALTVDGVAQEGAVVAERRDDALWVRVADAPALAPFAGGAAEVALDRVGGLAYRIDPTTQSLAITLPPVARRRARGAAGIAPAPEITPNGWGGYLNYDVLGTAVAGRTTADAALDLRLFSPRVLGYAGVVVHAGRRFAGQRSLVRLDSGVTLPEPGRARRWTAGDFIGGGTSATRPVRIGGVQLTSDFGLRPDLVTFPVPAIAGQAAVPTVADVLTDSAVRAGGAVPGEFASGAAPVTTAPGSVGVVSRDVLGRESVQTLSLSAARALLLPGLSAVSLEAGFVRTGYATAADRYRRPVAAATYRRGLSERLTLEAHGEASTGVAMASGGATLGLGGAGTVYLAAAASRGRLLGHARGAQLTAGWERLARPVSLAVRYTRGTAGFADVAARYGSGVRRETLIANVGFDLGRFGTLSAAAVRLGPGRRPPVDAAGRVIRYGPPGAPATRRLDPLTLLSGTTAVPVASRFSLVASATRALGGVRAMSASAGLLMLLGPRRTAQAGVETRDGGVAGRMVYAAPAVVPGDIGYRADLASGQFERQAVQVEHIGARGRSQAAVERVGGIAAVRLAAQGALALTPHGLFRADRIDGSFALVDAQGEAGLPVFRENRPAGETGRRGYLIVTGLLPYQPNRISLDPRALDMAIGFDAAERFVRPREFAGTEVTFGIRRETGVVVRLVDAAGGAIPAGARASLNGGAAVPVGLDGEAYLSGPGARNHLRVSYGDRTCEARFAAPPVTAGARVADPIPCL